MRDIIICISILFLLNVSHFTQAQVRKYSNEFLAIGVGGRGLAMANAQIASTGDVSSLYWNPAGISRIEEDFQLGIMHAEYFAGIAKYDFGGVVLPLKGRERFAGLSLIRFGVDDIPNTMFLIEPDGSINYDNITTFSIADYAFTLSYAQPIKVKGMRLGGNVKIIHRKAGEFASAWGFGIDAGMQYDWKDFRFGIMARDITGTFNAWSFNFTEDEKEVLLLTGNEIPTSSLEVTVPKIIFGAAYAFTVKDKLTIFPELNFDMTTDGKRNVLIKTNSISIDPHFGLELSYAGIVYLRGGIGNIQQSTDDQGEKITTFQPTMGVGLKIKHVRLDYAFTDIGDQSDALYSHVFSLGLGFVRKTTQK